MGKGRDKRRRKAKGKDEVRVAKGAAGSGEPFGLFDPDASVSTRLKPKPTIRSGGVALPEPALLEPEESEAVFREAISVRFSK
jgi:hypothetical protein